MITKAPPFLVSDSFASGRFIIHTREPKFIAKVFRPDLETEEQEIKAKLTHWAEIDFKGRRTIIGIIDLWEPEASEDRIQGRLKRLQQWYKSIMIEEYNNGKL